MGRRVQCLSSGYLALAVRNNEQGNMPCRHLQAYTPIPLWSQTMASLVAATCSTGCIKAVGHPSA